MNAPVAQLTTAPDLPNDRYWATVDGEKLPQTILSKALRYRDRLRRDGRIDLFRRSERVYYGQDANGGMANSVAVQFGGEAGELVMVRVNHYRSILQGIIATVVNRRLAYDPRATNNDIESANQVTLAKALLEYYALARRRGHAREHHAHLAHVRRGLHRAALGRHARSAARARRAAAARRGSGPDRAAARPRRVGGETSTSKSSRPSRSSTTSTRRRANCSGRSSPTARTCGTSSRTTPSSARRS